MTLACRAPEISEQRRIGGLRQTGWLKRVCSPLAGALLGLSLLLLLHRYAGIRHDSILYLGQVQMERHPEALGQDLFFLYGSQGRYSLFPALTAQLAAWFPLPGIFLWGTLLGLLLFAFASWSAISAMLPPRQRYWSWLAVLCLPAVYGAISMFSYGEAFFTPRLFAESLCLLCIGRLARGRWLSAAACLLLAGLLHPLQAIAASLILWPWLVARDRRWLHALWGLLPLLVLASAGIAPFADLLRQTDPQWLRSLLDSWQLYLLEWGLEDYRVLAFDVFLLVAARLLLKGNFGTWCQSALIGLALGFGASLLLVDWLHLVLPTSLQLWRVHWLAHLLAVAAFAALLYRHVAERDPARALLLMLLGQLIWGRMPFGWIELLLAYTAWPWLTQGNRARLKPLLGALFAGVLLLLLTRHVMGEWEVMNAAAMRPDRYPLEVTILGMPLLALGLPLAGWWLWNRATLGLRIGLAVAVLLPVNAWAALNWDARSQQTRAIEAAAGMQSVFGIRLPVDAQVFWEPESLVATWLVLDRANYFSYSQFAGQMFQRGTFADGRARENRMLPLLQESKRCMQESQRNPACHVSAASLHRACMAGRTSHPDYIVLPYAQPETALGEWRVPGLLSAQEAVTFRIYACRDLLDPHVKG